MRAKKYNSAASDRTYRLRWSSVKCCWRYDRNQSNLKMSNTVGCVLECLISRLSACYPLINQPRSVTSSNARVVLPCVFDVVELYRVEE